MNLNAINPALLVFVAAVLLAWATYNYQTRQSQSSAATRQRLDDAVSLMQRMATQTGNSEVLQEVIDARTKLLATSRAAEDEAVEKILARVPQLTEEYRKLEASKSSAADRLMAEYRAKWEPVIRFAVAEFDRRLAVVSASGAQVRVTKEENFQVAGIGQAGGNSQLVRVADMNGVQLRLYCTSAQIHPTRLESGHLVITVRIPEKTENESNPLSVGFDLGSASAGGRSFDTSASDAATDDLTDAITAGINKGIEDFLVIANARR